MTISRFSHRLFSAGLVLALLHAPAALGEDSSQRLSIVDQAIEHHGGDRYSSSETHLDLCSKSGCYHLRQQIDGPRYDHTVEGTVRGTARKVRVTNDTVELWRDEALVALGEEDAQRMRDWAMARLYFPFLPYRLNDPSVYKEDRGLETWDGRALRRIKVTFTPGSSTDADDEYLYWLDPETGRVEMLAYSYTGSPDGLRFRRATNHRRVGGILFFDQENYGAEAEGLRVDVIDPEYVSTMRHVSTITLRDIVVKPLGDASNRSAK